LVNTAKYWRSSSGTFVARCAIVSRLDTIGAHMSITLRASWVRALMRLRRLRSELATSRAQSPRLDFERRPCVGIGLRHVAALWWCEGPPSRIGKDLRRLIGRGVALAVQPSATELLHGRYPEPVIQLV